MAERTFTQTLTSLIPKFGTFGDNAIVRKPEFLLDVIHSAPVGLLAVDAKGSIVLFNERAKMNLSMEVPSDEWIGKKLLDLANFSSRFLSYAEDLVAGKLEPYELLELPVEGKHLTIRSKKIKGGHMLALTDVTDLKIMEAASLSATIEGQENERSRLARELHDGIGPLLSTINLHLEGIQPEIGALGKDAQRKFRSVRNLVNTLTGETRAISHALMPAAVEDLGLVTALEDVFEKTRDSADISVHFFSSGMEERLHHQAELGLYRIVQELLNNALKYAKAKSLNVQLIRHKESVVLTYEDDGIGFDPEPQAPFKGLGLRDISARVTSLGGTFSLDSSPGRGVLATVEIPV